MNRVTSVTIEPVEIETKLTSIKVSWFFVNISDNTHLGYDQLKLVIMVCRNSRSGTRSEGSNHY